MERPGGNVTGTSDITPMDKQLQLFKDIDPSAKKLELYSILVNQILMFK